MRLCASPRIAVCNRTLMCCTDAEQQMSEKTHLLGINGGEHEHARTRRHTEVPFVLFCTVSRYHKRGQTPTSSLYWCVSGCGFCVTDVASSVRKKYFLLMRPLSSSFKFPLEPGSSVPLQPRAWFQSILRCCPAATNLPLCSKQENDRFCRPRDSIHRHTSCSV